MDLDKGNEEGDGENGGTFLAGDLCPSSKLSVDRLKEGEEIKGVRKSEPATLNFLIVCAISKGPGLSSKEGIFLFATNLSDMIFCFLRENKRVRVCVRVSW